MSISGSTNQSRAGNFDGYFITVSPANQHRAQKWLPTNHGPRILTVILSANQRRGLWSRDEVSTNESYLGGDQGQGLEGGGVVEPLVVSVALAAEVVKPGHLVQLRHEHAVVLLLQQPRPQPRHLGAPVLASVRQVVDNNLLNTQSHIQPPPLRES